MASMDDLIATISGGLHAGQQGNDLKDLHAKLTQSLHPSIPTYRPIAPNSSAQTNGNQVSQSATSGPFPPPAPASSWNSPPPAGSAYLHPGMFPRNTASGSSGVNGGANGVNGGGANGQTQLNGAGGNNYLSPNQPVSNGVPAPRQMANGKGIPYHTEVLPVRASPKDTGGFADDAFRPLWNGNK